MRVRSGMTMLGGILLASVSVFAGPLGTVNEIVAFGDSLSDAGNASILTDGREPESRGPGYYYRSVSGIPFPVGEFTNAPASGGPTGVWLDQLAPKLGIPMAQPYLAGGTNFAVADAVTGNAFGNTIGTQIGLFSAATAGSAPANALYTIWGGANDIFGITNPAAASTTGVAAADNLYSNILTLSSEGARYFLWSNLPDLGKTPAALAEGAGASAVATLASSAFDAEWAADLLKLQSDGISVVGLDVASLFAEIEADPAKYGFSSVAGSAIAVPGADPNTYLFWDDVHPTAAADALIADAAFADLTATAAPTPEPAALGLAGAGLAALFITSYRRRALRK